MIYHNIINNFFFLKKQKFSLFNLFIIKNFLYYIFYNKRNKFFLNKGKFFKFIFFKKKFNFLIIYL
jgi:hypothetical protein